MLTSTITPRTSKQLTMVLQLDKVDKTLIVANQLELDGYWDEERKLRENYVTTRNKCEFFARVAQSLVSN